MVLGYFAEKFIYKLTTVILSRLTGDENMLVEKTEYLSAGIHIGMKTCTPYMKRFVYKVREDGVSVFNLQIVDERIKTAAAFISRFQKPMVIGKKESAKQGIEACAKAIGAKGLAGRFPPGTITNPSFKDFYEPDVILIVDPLIDQQAINEAKKKRIPVVGLCDTFNNTKDIDLVIPLNNNGKKSLSLFFWILTKEMLKSRGKVKADKDYKLTPKDFGYEEEEKEAAETGQGIG